MFAVRQWPGNGADLDFRGVLKGCTAAIVAAAPIEGTLLKDGNTTDEGGVLVVLDEALTIETLHQCSTGFGLL